MTTENKENRRSNQHSKQSFNSPRDFLWIFFLVGVLMLVSYGTYTVYNKIKDHELQEYLENQTSQLVAQIDTELEKNDLPSEKKEHDSNTIKEIIYLPKETEKLPYKNTEEQLTHLMKQESQKLKHPKQAVVVGCVEKHAYTDQLSSYALHVETYDWKTKEQTFQKEQERTEKEIYVNIDSGEEITAKALIGSKANLLGIQQVIQQKLLDDAENPQEILEVVLALPRFDFKDATYTPEHLQINLPKNETGVDEVTLAYRDIQAFIQTNLVDPNQLAKESTDLDPNKKYVSLTFDDGPGAETTPRLLQILAEKNVKATFFMLGQMAEEFPQIVKDVYEQGHEIASHSYSHPQLNAIPKEELLEQVRMTDKAIYNAAGILPRTLRPPYGAISPESADIIGKPIIQWDIDSYDWDSKNTNAVIDRVNQTSFEGGIILMHDIHPTTIDAVGTVIDNLRAQGYEFVTTSQLLEQKEKPLYQYFGQKDAREI